MGFHYILNPPRKNLKNNNFGNETVLYLICNGINASVRVYNGKSEQPA